MEFYKNKYNKYKNKYMSLKKAIEHNGLKIPIKAIGIFNQSNIRGKVIFEETNNFNVRVHVELEGFDPNTSHGFHVHKYGDISNGCESMCEHFNPYGMTHGDRTDTIRHVGDLGNLHADENGKVQLEFEDSVIKLRGEKANIIGRGLIIHADPDDCGRGEGDNYEQSKKTGNSGKRIGCAIIGIC